MKNIRKSALVVTFVISFRVFGLPVQKAVRRRRGSFSVPTSDSRPSFFLFTDANSLRLARLHSIKYHFFAAGICQSLFMPPCPSSFCSRPHYNHCTELRERETRTRSAKNTGWIRMKNTANVQLRFHTECISYARSNENSVYFFDNNTLCLHLPLAFFCLQGRRAEGRGGGGTKKSLFFLP